EGGKLLAHKDDALAVRNRLGTAMFTAWWFPFSRFGVIHGDPDFGSYTVLSEDGVPGGINLLDYGCIRIFPPKFVGGVVDLYHGLLHGDDNLVVHAYETWGFRRLSRELIESLNIWARFIYGPLLQDRVRSIADGVKPSEYGRREAFRVHQALKQKGPVTIPREFVFMDRAAIGLGGVFLHLNAKLNFYRLFNEALGPFSFAKGGGRQPQACGQTRVVVAGRRTGVIMSVPRRGSVASEQERFMKAAFLVVAAGLVLALASVPTTGALAQGTSAKAKAGKTEYMRAAVDTPTPV